MPITFNPLTPKMSLVILLTGCQMMLKEKFCFDHSQELKGEKQQYYFSELK